MSDARKKAKSFLAGGALTYEQANALWRECRGEGAISEARLVLSRIRNEANSLLDRIPPQREVKEELCREEASLTSKDPELNSRMRHDRAIEILAEEFNLDDSRLNGDAETLGIAGGIYKRKWEDCGQLADIKRSAQLYERGAEGALGEDAYPHINAAFLDDLLAELGDDPERRRNRAATIRQNIIDYLPITGTWWNAATIAEAYFGMKKYADAKQALAACSQRPEPWW